MGQIVEAYRAEALRRIFATSKFSMCWPTWRTHLLDLTDGFSSAEKIYGLGSNLRTVFGTTAKAVPVGGKKGRDQDELAGGGAAWEALVCWYLNTVLTGTDAVVAKHSKSLIPTPLLDAISINYQNKPTNSESDLIGVIFPSNLDSLVPVFGHLAVSAAVGANMGKTGAHIIQCKTNWNDNAQIPMLWDLVYKAAGFNANNLTVGKDGRDISDLKSFSYSFVTVPTQKSQFKAGSMPVRRVSSLSGGNYWGQATEPGIAWSLSEMFKRVFGSAVIGDVRGHIDKMLQNGRILLP